MSFNFNIILNLIHDYMSSIIIKKLKQQHQKKVYDVTFFINMQSKLWYDKQHTFLHIKMSNKVYLHFNQEYCLSEKSLSKVSNQHCESFEITEKVRKLIFWLALSETWRIYSMMSISQLKSDSKIDSYKQFQLEWLSSIKVNRKVWYIINCIVSKKQMKHFQKIHYLIWWKGFTSEKDTWESINKFIENS